MPKILTTGDAARFCLVAPRTISKWCDAGKMPCTREAGTGNRLIDADALAAFMDDNGLAIPPELEAMCDAPPPVRVAVEAGDTNTLRTVARNGQPVGTVRERPGIGVRAGESVWEARNGFRKNAIELGTFRTMEEAAEAVAR